MNTLKVLLVDFDPYKKTDFFEGLNIYANDDGYDLEIVYASPFEYENRGMQEQNFDLVFISGITAQNNTGMIENLKKQGLVIGISCLSEFKSHFEKWGVDNFINLSDLSSSDAWEQIEKIVNIPNNDPTQRGSKVLYEGKEYWIDMTLQQFKDLSSSRTLTVKLFVSAPFSNENAIPNGDADGQVLISKLTLIG